MTSTYDNIFAVSAKKISYFQSHPENPEMHCLRETVINSYPIKLVFLGQQFIHIIKIELFCAPKNQLPPPGPNNSSILSE